MTEVERGESDVSTAIAIFTCMLIIFPFTLATGLVKVAAIWLLNLFIPASYVGFWVWMALLLQGQLTGTLSLFATAWLFKQANMTAVAFATATLWVAVALLYRFFSPVEAQYTSTWEAVTQVGGIVWGLVYSSRKFREKRSLSPMPELAIQISDQSLEPPAKKSARRKRKRSTKKKARQET